MNFFRWFLAGFTKSVQAYSLSEMLLALMIVGSITTFTIPKVFTAQSDAQRQAVLKETIASFSETVEIGRATGSLSVSNYGDYMLTHINAVKVCPNNAYTEGCWDQTTQGDIPSEAGQPGLVLANGATIMGIDNNCCVLSPGEWCNGMVLDYNGKKGPNIMGQDQILLEVNYGTIDGQTGWCADNRRGTVAVEESEADSVWGH